MLQTRKCSTEKNILCNRVLYFIYEMLCFMYTMLCYIYTTLLLSWATLSLLTQLQVYFSSLSAMSHNFIICHCYLSSKLNSIFAKSIIEDIIRDIHELLKTSLKVLLKILSVVLLAELSEKLFTSQKTRCDMKKQSQEILEEYRINHDLENDSEDKNSSEILK